MSDIHEEMTINDITRFVNAENNTEKLTMQLALLLDEMKKDYFILSTQENQEQTIKQIDNDYVEICIKFGLFSDLIERLNDNITVSRSAARPFFDMEEQRIQEIYQERKTAE